MFSTIAIIVLLLVALYFLIAGPKFSESDTEYSLRLVGVIPLIIALVWSFFACTQIIEAKQQGVLLTFGKPSDRTLSPGLNLKLPWQKVVAVDTTRQTDNFNNGSQETDHSTISVRLGNGNVSDFYASVTWQINDEQANTVYGEFRGEDPTEEVYKKLIAPNFKAAVNLVGGTYNPTAEIANLTDQDVADAAEINLAPDFDDLAQRVEEDFLKRVTPETGEPLVVILQVQVSFLAFDESTQGKINEYQNEVQKTIIAAQAVKTAEEQAKANETIAASISKDPNVLASRCFDLLADGSFTPPAGFSCYPGSTGSVVIPSAAK